jgi:hypothetical protein
MEGKEEMGLVVKDVGVERETRETIGKECLETDGG